MNTTRLCWGKLGLTALLASSLVACALDGVNGPGDQNGEVERIPSPEPGVDDRLDALGIICESTLTVTGTYTPTTAQPPDHLGCWEVGIWTVKTAINFLGCDPQEELATEYVYEITRDDEDVTNVAYQGDFDPERMNLKITTQGDSLCHGSFEHFREDGVVFTFQPVLQLDGTLLGQGAYSVWAEDPF